MHLRQRIQDILGEGYLDALFYRFPGGLRFALSEGGGPLDHVLTALRKATAVCHDIFIGEQNLHVHLVSYVPQSLFGLRATLRELRSAGVVIPRGREIWLESEPVADDDAHDPGLWLHCAFPYPTAKLQNLIWCAITNDFGSIRPNPHCRVYLLHLEKEIVVHPYDDRGMDVIGRQMSLLAELYEKHVDLLLEYDLDAMRHTFGKV